MGVLAMGPLTLALQDEDEAVRREAIVALGSMVNVAASKPLLEALKDGSAEIRTASAEFGKDRR
jgi:HEAT repeat protein